MLVVTRDELVASKLHLWNGCFPLLYTAPRPDGNAAWMEDVDNRVKFAVTVRAVYKKSLLCEQQPKTYDFPRIQLLLILVTQHFLVFRLAVTWTASRTAARLLL